MSLLKLLAPVLVVVLVLSCSTRMPAYRVKFAGNTLQVPVLAFESSDMTLVRDDQAAYDILLIKHSPLAYNAYWMKCSYGDHPLTLTPDGMFCKEDGSEFDFEGAVKKGPADTALTEFPTTTSDNPSDINQGMVTINIQSLGI